MNKYWMVYRPSQRRELGEDFSSREPQIEESEQIMTTEPTPSRLAVFITAVRNRLRRKTAVSTPLAKNA